MTEPYTPEHCLALAEWFTTWHERPDDRGDLMVLLDPSLAATLRAYASLLTREAKMREALEEIARRGGDCGRIALRALEETK
jgi:hypothetical protein